MTSAVVSPVRVTAQLESGLSRWLWLVKWLLVVPHLIVLGFLWIAFGVLSVVAFIAILVTGRYPRSIFEFNLGVLRWSWRVAYYCYGALGTDRYPPFTLGPAPDYPATLDIAYPGPLSRGLVLVKWLLALPHYVIIPLRGSRQLHRIQRGHVLQLDVRRTDRPVGGHCRNCPARHRPHQQRVRARLRPPRAARRGHEREHRRARGRRAA
jgi:hypothetical protein